MEQAHKTRNLPIIFLGVIAVLLLCSVGSVSAAEKLRDGILLDTYHRIESKLEKNSFGCPLYMESSDRDSRVHVDVYGVINHPFNSVLNVLQVPANWCDIISLHPNIKACTYRELPGAWQLNFYSGRKVYQSPEDTYKFTFRYRNVEQRQGYLNVVLSADEGPLSTKDHKMALEALSLNSGRTLIHVSYAYIYGLPLRLAGKIYFATLGRDKVGFTVSRTDSNGNPIYIGGPRGAVERNAVRYYFAIQSFMDTMRFPEESRFSIRISEWHDLTSRYRKQLFEMDKKDYLTSKTEEHKNQVRLQRLILTSFQ